MLWPRLRPSELLIAVREPRLALLPMLFDMLLPMLRDMLLPMLRDMLLPMLRDMPPLKPPLMLRDILLPMLRDILLPMLRDILLPMLRELPPLPAWAPAGSANDMAAIAKAIVNCFESCVISAPVSYESFCSVRARPGRTSCLCKAVTLTICYTCFPTRARRSL
jgi:hypothetical protein